MVWFILSLEASYYGIEWNVKMDLQIGAKKDCNTKIEFKYNFGYFNVFEKRLLSDKWVTF